MASRSINAREKYLLSNYKHLMSTANRLMAQSLVAADFDLDQIQKAVWRRVWNDLPGIDKQDPWKLPIAICLRLLKDHRSEIKVPHEII